MATPGAQRTSLENRLTGPIDGVLHLLDRQLIDSDGEFLGKVDDVELTPLQVSAAADTGVGPVAGSTPDGGGLAITGVLTGPAALLDRFGGALGRVLVERWGQMRMSEPHRTRPWRIDIDDIDRLDSAVHLRVRRDGVLRRDRDAYRLGRLTGMGVLDPEGTRIGRVLDARFEPKHSGSDRDSGNEHLVLCSIIVGHGRPGSLLGYDRRADQGPWLVRIVVRWLHRHSVIVDAEDAAIDWAAGTVRLRSRPTARPTHPYD
jgi:sporulation protein YlmC with PRC-barrel domain